MNKRARRGAAWVTRSPSVFCAHRVASTHAIASKHVAMTPMPSPSVSRYNAGDGSEAQHPGAVEEAGPGHPRDAREGEEDACAEVGADGGPGERGAHGEDHRHAEKNAVALLV